MLKAKRNIDVVKLHKSGGVVARNPKVRQQARSLRIKVIWSSLVYPSIFLNVKYSFHLLCFFKYVLLLIADK